MPFPRLTVDWTPGMDAALTAAWREGGIAAARVAFPQFGRRPVYARAGVLGLRRRAWTPDDNARLRRLWDSELPLSEIASRLRRSEVMTYQHAADIGLSCGVPENWEYLTHAARRTGFETDTLRRVLLLAGGTIRRKIVRPRDSQAKPGNKWGSRPRFLVASAEVDAAVEHWCSTEPVAVIAKRKHICPVKLRRLLRLAGVKQVRPVGHPVRNARPEWRVTEEDVEKALSVREALRHDRRRGSPAPLPPGGGVADQRGSAATLDPADSVMPVRCRFTPGRPAGRSATSSTGAA